MRLFQGWWVDSREIKKDFGDRAYVVATIADWSEDTEHLVNIISAAPEMLEALVLASNILRNAGQKPSPHNNLGIIEAAIAKARGSYAKD